MKQKILFLVFTLFQCVSLFTQNVTIEPRVRFESFNIRQITITSDATYVMIDMICSNCNLQKEVYLSVEGTDLRYKLQSTYVSIKNGQFSNMRLDLIYMNFMNVVVLKFPKIPHIDNKSIYKVSIKENSITGFRWSGVEIYNPINANDSVLYVNETRISPTTNMKESLIKEKWENSGIENVEGIYEGVDGAKYKLALIKQDNDNFQLIYLAHKLDYPWEYSLWREGDIKAKLTTTATPFFYKTKWYMADKSLNENAYINIDKGKMTLILDSEETSYVKLYPTASNRNTKIRGSEWRGNGSGFFIDFRGYITTNYHVIKDANEIEVEFIRNGQLQTFKVEVIQSDKQNDLAVLKIIDESFKSFTSIPYNFQTTLSDVGTNVFALGYPMTSIMGSEIKFTDGKISSKTGIQGDITMYQISVPIQAGSSGGALFDYDGNLIGITSAGLNRDYFNSENVNYAIKTSYLKNLIDVLPVPIQLPSDKTINTKTLTEKIKILSDYVVLIKIR